MNRPLALQCAHCLAPVPADAIVRAEIEGVEQVFCCHGCEGAFRMIQGAGLGDFYAKRQPLASSAPGEPAPLEDLDEEGLIEQYAQPQGELLKIRLVLSGLHCAACVWLNENILEQLSGVHEARVNYSTHKASVVWDPRVISLARVFETIRSIGYDARPYAPGRQESVHQDAQANYLDFVVALFASMNLMWVAVAQWAGYFQGMETRFVRLFDLAGFLLATPVIFFSGRRFLKGAWAGLKRGLLGMDFQIGASGLLIWGYSIYAGLSGRGETFFEAAVMLITFVLGAKLLEALTLKSILDRGDQLTGELPQRALRVVGERVQSYPAGQIQPGWVLEAPPHEPFLADGKVLEGRSSADESFLTGESRPMAKQPGDPVFATAMNHEGRLRYEVGAKPDQAVASQIAQLIEAALEDKPPFERLAERLSKHFVGAVTLLSLSAFGYWTWAQTWEQGFAVALAVLVIACPCALALATPLAYLSGLAKAARQGILFKSAAGLERLEKTTDLVLDKTGTLSLGRPQVVAQWSEPLFAATWARALVERSSHPVAHALAELWSDATPAHLEAVHEYPGQGLTGEINGVALAGGGLNWLNAQWPEEAQALIEAHREASLFGLMMAGRPVALFALEDQLKPGAEAACAQLRQAGLKLHLLSGDRPGPVERAARETGTHAWRAQMSPKDKLEYVRALQAQGAQVAMVGDGINDAPALAQSGLALVMGQGAVKSLALADLVILGGEPQALVRARRLARGTASLLRSNLGLSFGYNLLVVPLALAGWVIPLVAALSMSLSSVLVVMNSYVFGRRN